MRCSQLATLFSWVLPVLPVLAWEESQTPTGSEWQDWKPSPVWRSSASQISAGNWAAWSSPPSQSSTTKIACPPPPPASTVTIIDTAPPNAITVTSELDVISTTTSVTTVSVDFTKTVETTISQQGTDTVTVTTGAPLCAGGTTYNTYITTCCRNVTATVTTTETVYLPCESQSCCSQGSGTNDTQIVNEIVLELEAYLEDTYTTELNETITIPILQNINSSISQYFNDSFTATLNASISEVLSIEIDNSVNSTLNKYFDTTFVTRLSERIEAYLNETLNGDTLNISVPDTAFDNITCRVNLTANNIDQLNSSITGVLLAFLYHQLTDRSSQFSDTVTTVLSDQSTPWWAIALLVLLLVFGLATLLGLAWLICFRRTKVHHKKREKGEPSCQRCGEPRSSCGCEEGPLT